MSSNRTTQRALQILCLLAKRPDGMTLSEISLELEMPKTSAFDILQTLRQEHFLRETHKRFSIGYMAHEVGRSYQPDRDLYGIVRPELPPLGDKFGMTASLVFHEEEGLVYALEYRPANSIVSSGASSGYSFIHASASGKAIFAYLSPAKLKKELKKLSFTALTENTITNEESFLKELSKVKSCGYAVDRFEFNALQTCISVPIFHSGQVVAAVTLSGLQVHENEINTIASDIMKTVKNIEGMMLTHVKS